MKAHPHRRCLLIPLLALGCPGGPALAMEACVRCDRPFAIYRCQVNDPALSPNASIALLCITELAKKNGHATCAITRDTATNCSGEVAEVSPSLDAPLPQPPPDGQVEATPETAADQASSQSTSGELPRIDGKPTGLQDTPPENTMPETVEELAKETAKATKDGLDQAGTAVVDATKKTGQTIEKTGEAISGAAKKTGDAIGNAAKKTWRCISSLFGNC